MDKVVDWVFSPKIVVTRNLLKLVALIGATINSLYCMYIYATLPYLLLISSNILLQVLAAYYGIAAAISGAEAYQNGKRTKTSEAEQKA